jgi:hypothetical protein
LVDEILILQDEKVSTCAFGLTVDKIDFDRIEFGRIDFDKIEFDRIDLCLDTII